MFSTVLGLVHTTLEIFANGVFTLKTRQLFSVHATPEKFENVVFTLKNYDHQMFSVHTTLEEFENVTVTCHFGFVFEESSGRKSRDYRDVTSTVLEMFSGHTKTQSFSKRSVYVTDYWKI